MSLHRLAEERSLAIHRVVAERVRERPELLARARERVQDWLRDGNVAAPYARAWANALDGPRETLLALLVDPAEEARALRQCSPFAGLVGPRERWRIWRETRERWEQAS